MVTASDVLMIDGLGKILSAIKSMYEESMCHVCKNRSKSGRTFKKDVGLCQGWVISSSLFNVYIGGVVREVNTSSD
jgi:hypothetical protein